MTTSTQLVTSAEFYTSLRGVTPVKVASTVRKKPCGKSFYRRRSPRAVRKDRPANPKPGKDETEKRSAGPEQAKMATSRRPPHPSRLLVSRDPFAPNRSNHLGTDLVAALAGLQVDDFSHLRGGSPRGELRKRSGSLEHASYSHCFY